MFDFVAAYSMKEFGSISPEDCDAQSQSRKETEKEQIGLTERKIKETVEPASACSPIDFSLLVGFRDSILTTGAPVLSCRIVDRDVIR